MTNDLLDAFGSALGKSRQVLFGHLLPKAVERQLHHHYHRCRVAVPGGQRDLHALDALLFVVSGCGLRLLLLQRRQCRLRIDHFPIGRQAVAEAQTAAVCCRTSRVGACASSEHRKNEQSGQQTRVHFAASLPCPSCDRRSPNAAPRLYFRNSTETAEAIPASEKTMPKYQ